MSSLGMSFNDSNIFFRWFSITLSPKPGSFGYLSSGSTPLIWFDRLTMSGWKWRRPLTNGGGRLPRVRESLVILNAVKNLRPVPRTNIRLRCFAEFILN